MNAAALALTLLAGSSIRVTQFAELPEPPLAVAAGDLSGPAVAALTPVAVYVFRQGVRLRYQLPAAGPEGHPVRDPAGGVVVAGGRVLWALPSLHLGGVLRLSDTGAALVAAGDLPESRVPLAAGPSGILSGMAQPGRSTFEAALLVAAGPDDEAPRSGSAPGPVLAAASGRKGTAFFVRTAAGLVPLGPDLTVSGPIVLGVGSGFAAADLLGDGRPLLVASSASASAPDRIRVLPLAGGPASFESQDIAAVLWCGAAFDLDGDGREDVVLAGRGPGAGGVIFEVHAP